MKYLLVLILTSIAFAQVYEVKIWGIPVGNARIEHSSDNEIELNLRIHEAVKPIYPVKINYYSKYNNFDHTIINVEKTVEQGSNSFEYKINYENGFAIYNGKDTININTSVYSFLSLIDKIVRAPIDSVDTKWFDIENEGTLYRARPLWNDSTNITIDNKKYFCDHYRLDMRMVDDSKKLYEETDYFNELFFDINSVRQIWVENWQKQRRLVKIKLKNTFLSLEITIRD